MGNSLTEVPSSQVCQFLADVHHKASVPPSPAGLLHGFVYILPTGNGSLLSLLWVMEYLLKATRNKKNKFCFGVSVIPITSGSCAPKVLLVPLPEEVLSVSKGGDLRW